MISEEFGGLFSWKGFFKYIYTSDHFCRHLPATSVWKWQPDTPKMFKGNNCSFMNKRELDQKIVDVSPIAKCTFNAVLHETPPPLFHQIASLLVVLLPFTWPSCMVQLRHQFIQEIVRAECCPSRKEWVFFPKRIDLVGVRAAQSHYLSLLASSCSQDRNRKRSPRPTESAILNPFSHVSRSFFQDFLKVQSPCFSFSGSLLAINQHPSIRWFWTYFRKVGCDRWVSWAIVILLTGLNGGNNCWNSRILWLILTSWLSKLVGTIIHTLKCCLRENSHGVLPVVGRI